MGRIISEIVSKGGKFAAQVFITAVGTFVGNMLYKLANHYIFYKNKKTEK